MKTVVFERIGAPFAFRDVPPPSLVTGEVIVDVFAAFVLSYAQEVFSGQRTYPLDLPVVPGTGSIGQVRAIGNDSTKLKIGDWVFCDPTIRARDDVVAPDIMLQGLDRTGARTPAASSLGRRGCLG
jgi:alcohol dehydrogenase